MRVTTTPVVLLALLLLSRGAAADRAVPSPAANAAAFKIAPVESRPVASKFSDVQLAFVQTWIKQKARECPIEVSETVADQFLNELQQRNPDKFSQLLSRDFPQTSFESMLLRHVGLKLSGAGQTSQREKVAERRVAALLIAGGREFRAANGDATGLIAKLKDSSPSQFRRLVEGKMDDDDLQLAIKKAGQSGVAQKEPAVAKPKVLSAADIVSEFSRRNQTGSALQRLNAYVVDGRLKTATGEEQQLLFFKMRPDSFRLVVRAAGITRYILAGDGSRYWQQTTGQAPQDVPVAALGQRRYLAEFVDPLFASEGYSYERLEDGSADGRKFYRIAVERADKSRYVSCIDAESFHEVIRENADKSTTRYSDYREVGGVTYAFREEVTDPAGHKGVLELTRITANPGLIQDLFDLPSRQELGYFEIEKILSPASRTVGQSH